MSSEDVIDPAVISALRRAQDEFGNPEFISQLIGLFRARTPGKMDAIRQAIAAGDAAVVREVAHTLLSNCGMLGAARMADACARMEEAAARADFPAASSALQDAEQQLPSVLSALSTL